MPTYEYLCKTCSHRFEKWQKMADEPLTICPECGGTIRRVFYPAGIVFKGSGFYKTDHSASSTADANGHTPKSEKDSSASTGETSAAAESKPASTKSKPNTSGTSTSTSENKAAAAATK